MTMAPVCRCTLRERLAGHTFKHCPYYEHCSGCDGTGYVDTRVTARLPGVKCSDCDGTGARGWQPLDAHSGETQEVTDG